MVEERREERGRENGRGEKDMRGGQKRVRRWRERKGKGRGKRRLREEEKNGEKGRGEIRGSEGGEWREERQRGERRR